MRSDSIIKEDPRAQVLVAPPGSNSVEYNQVNMGRGGRRGRGRAVRARRGGRQSGGRVGAGKMEVD